MKKILLVLSLFVLALCVFLVPLYTYQGMMQKQRDKNELLMQQAHQERMAEQERWFKEQEKKIDQRMAREERLFKEQERKIDQRIEKRMLLEEDASQKRMQDLIVILEQLKQHSPKEQMTQENQWGVKQRKQWISPDYQRFLESKEAEKERESQERIASEKADAERAKADAERAKADAIADAIRETARENANAIRENTNAIKENGANRANENTVQKVKIVPY